MKKYPKVSIIIPLFVKTPYFFEAVERCLELDYPDFEILIGVDKGTKLKFNNPTIRVLKTGTLRTGPAEKRDIGIIKATGQIIAFLDDDSYPEKDWLKKAVQVINKVGVSSVCGPGLTPPTDDLSQQITGAVLGSRFGSGPYYYRFIKGKPHFVDDYPAYNLIVRRGVLLKLGGFGTKFYGGEDTALCIKLINSGEKIYYHPDIVVYHHRRKFPFEYIKQVENVGLHRGYFAKAYPQTSLRISYFSPAVLTVGLAALFLYSLYNYQILVWSLLLFSLVYILVLMESLGKTSLMISAVLPLAVLINHLAYGFNFIKGFLFTNKLER